MGSSTVTVFCRTCNAPRYRSIRPLTEKDKIDPRLFAPIDPEIPPATEGQASCYLCTSPLVFVWDEKGKMPRNTQAAVPALADAPPAPPARHTPEEILRMAQEEQDGIKPIYTENFPVPAVGSPSVETLFELQPGEEFKNVHDNPTYVLVVSTRRIVKILK